MIPVADIAGFVRLVVERPGVFQGKRVEIASDSLTGPEMAQVLAKASGTVIDYSAVPLTAVRAYSEDLARMFEWLDRVGYDCDVAALRRAYPEAGWHDFREWAHEQDWSVLDEAGPEQPTA